MEAWAIDLMQSMNYAGLILLMFLENVFPPIPSEVIMPAAGFNARQGDMTLWGVILAGSTGSLAGAIGWYWVARWVGKVRFERWVARHGQWIAVFPEDVEKADRWFEKRGKWAVFICRLIPGVRTLISVPAGLVEMPFGEFTLWSAIGTVMWTALLASLGWWMGDNYGNVAQVTRWLSYIVIALLIISIVSWIIKRRRQLRQRRADRQAPESTA